jgi:uncharacterized protein YxeA
MKKVLVTITTLFYLLSLGSVTFLADPGEPIGSFVKSDTEKTKEKLKDKSNELDNIKYLDPGDPIGT